MKDKTLDKQIKRAVNKLIKAEIAVSWKGAQPANTHEEIMENYKKAKDKFNSLMNKLSFLPEV